MATGVQDVHPLPYTGQAPAGAAPSAQVANAAASDNKGSPAVCRHAPTLNATVRAVGHRIERVLHQVDEHLLHLVDEGVPPAILDHRLRLGGGDDAFDDLAGEIRSADLDAAVGRLVGRLRRAIGQTKGGANTLAAAADEIVTAARCSVLAGVGGSWNW